MQENKPINEEPVFTGLVDLAAGQLGGEVLSASDEFFAEKENLLNPGRGEFIPGKFTDHGKWMDGWETRRKRSAGHDWCIIKLGLPGVIKALDIDTHHFIGNHPPYASVDGLYAERHAADTLPDADWREVLPRSPLAPGRQNLFSIHSGQTCTHIRLNIYPDGGIARFRAYGVVTPPAKKSGTVDLIALENGGTPVACSDMFFSPMVNLILPGKARNMGEGWESRRRRSPGHDWVILKSANPGYIKEIEVDTLHFKGNYPESCTIDACHADGQTVDQLNQHEINWTRVLDDQKLNPHHVHRFREEINEKGPFTHFRLNIYPDGGISRLRIFGDVVG